jgi:hypothetical protein
MDPVPNKAAIRQKDLVARKWHDLFFCPLIFLPRSESSHHKGEMGWKHFVLSDLHANSGYEQFER